IIVESGPKKRLERYLASKIDMTRSALKKLIEKELVRVDGSLKSAHYGVSAGEVIECEIPEKKKNIEPGKLECNIIYDDEDIAVVNKSPGVVVHPAPTTKGATLLNALACKYKSPHIVHRLDKDTSGVMIVALNEKAAYKIRKQFSQRKVRKVYKALAAGEIKQKSGEIAAPVKRSRRDPTKMRVGWFNARKAVTRFRVMKRYSNASFLELYPITGRTHQIRVHLSYMGHPILGDGKYSETFGAARRQMLHAERISFIHPGSGSRERFFAPLPDDFTGVLETLKMKGK
ncbi:MAG: RluA family pseudouridine synthase, partial [Elusimicrobiota bacterium]